MSMLLSIRSFCSLALCIFISAQTPVRADSNLALPFPCPTIEGKPVIESVLDEDLDKDLNQAKDKVAHRDKPIIVAQANLAPEVADVAAAGAVVMKKQKKDEPLITDSLWGNLILDMAYQRDPKIKHIMKRLNLVNAATMGTIAAIAGGTLAQGIITLATLNPPDGRQDSYLPGAIGVGMSGLTLVAFTGRAAINHSLMQKMHERQLEIKHQVEAILAQFESSQGANEAAQLELQSLIGPKATNEWVQLWRSSNVLAQVKPANISLAPKDRIGYIP